MFCIDNCLRLSVSETWNSSYDLLHRRVRETTGFHLKLTVV